MHFTENFEDYSHANLKVELAQPQFQESANAWLSIFLNPVFYPK